MSWVMLLLLVSGEVVGFPLDSEKACRANLARLAAGEPMTITFENRSTGEGFKMKVVRGIDCLQLSLETDKGAVL